MWNSGRSAPELYRLCVYGTGDWMSGFPYEFVSVRLGLGLDRASVHGYTFSGRVCTGLRSEASDAQ